MSNLKRGFSAGLRSYFVARIDMARFLNWPSYEGFENRTGEQMIVDRERKGSCRLTHRHTSQL